MHRKAMEPAWHTDSGSIRAGSKAFGRDRSWPTPAAQLSKVILRLLQFDTEGLIAAARSVSRSQRLQCLAGIFRPGTSYKWAWAL